MDEFVESAQETCSDDEKAEAQGRGGGDAARPAREGGEDREDQEDVSWQVARYRQHPSGSRSRPRGSSCASCGRRSNTTCRPDMFGFVARSAFTRRLRSRLDSSSSPGLCSSSCDRTWSESRCASPALASAGSSLRSAYSTTR